MLNEITATVVIEHDISDHAPLAIELSLKTAKKNIVRPYARKFSEQNLERFLIELDEKLRILEFSQQLILNC